MDDGLAPLFAEDHRRLGAIFGALAGGLDRGLHLGDERLGFCVCVDVCGDKADVFVDVGDRVRGQCEDGKAGFEDRGEGFEAIRDAGDDQVWFRGEDFVGVGGPAVVKDWEIAVG